MDKRRFLIRHGQSTFNEVYSVTGVDPLHYDARLTPKGRIQVAAAKSAARGLAVDLVVVSPLTRALETGLGLFDPAATKMMISPLHRERLANTCDIGRPPRELSSEFPMLDFGHLEECWWHVGPSDERGVSVEPEDVLALRVTRFEDWLRARPERRIAVVGHGTFFRGMTGRHFDNCECVEWRP